MISKTRNLKTHRFPLTEFKKHIRDGRLNLRSETGLVLHIPSASCLDMYIHYEAGRGTGFELTGRLYLSPPVVSNTA